MAETPTPDNLKDRLWRLNNLYYITDKKGKKVLFEMTPEQLEYYNGMHFRNVILKARQLGFTTEKCLIQLDAAIFEGAKCAMIAHSLPVAKRLFREKVMYAYNNLPDLIKAAMPANNQSAGELTFENGGSVYIDVSFRGGTLTYLHVSEFGKICAKFPEKAREIVTGAFEAVSSDGVITLESTAEGQSGYFYDYCQEAEAMALAKQLLSPLDWKFFFFSWWKNPQYSQEVPVSIPQRLVEYFHELKVEHGVKLTPEQQYWYTSKEKTLGDDMLREYPSIPEEAFQQSIEGAYYARQFKDLYSKKQITSVPHDPAAMVHTIWDIGVNDTNTIWFVQLVGREWHVIDYYENSGEGLQFYWDVLLEKAKTYGYRYGKHVGPHDLRQREWGNGAKTRLQTAQEIGLNFEVAPELSVMDGIQAVRNILPLCWFDKAMTEQGYTKLQQYRKAWDQNNGVWKNSPLHDENSHSADAFRYFAISIGLLSAAYGRRIQSQKATKERVDQSVGSPRRANKSSRGWT